MIALGISALGLLVGLLAGLSLSPVVGGLLSLIFAFAGSAAGFLPKERTPAQRQALGLLLFFFSIFVIAGLFAGIYLRNADPLRFDRNEPKFTFAESLKVEHLITLQEKGADAKELRAVVMADRLSDRAASRLKPAEIQRLVESNVPAEVIEALFLPLATSTQSGTVLFSDSSDATTSIEEDRKAQGSTSQ